MFKFIKPSKSSKKETILYIDFEEKYRFIIGEIFKDKAEVLFASSYDDLQRFIKPSQHKYQLFFYVLIK